MQDYPTCDLALKAKHLTTPTSLSLLIMQPHPYHNILLFQPAVLLIFSCVHLPGVEH